MSHMFGLRHAHERLALFTSATTLGIAYLLSHPHMVDCLGSTSLSFQSSCIWTISPYTVCYVSIQGST